MEEATISAESVRGQGVELISIDRPPVNALRPADWARLGEVVRHCAADESVRAIVLTGNGSAFCAGADVRGLAGDAPSVGGSTANAVVAATAATLRMLRVPVLAAIDGPAHGGGLELALACDIRLASDTATFAAAGVNMGLVASVGSLIAAIGDARARWMLLTGSTIGAERANAWGLAMEHDAPSVLDAALDLAAELASKPPLAVEATKLAATQYHLLSRADHDRLVNELFTELADTRDHAEALDAFLDKRPGGYGRR